MSNRSTGAHIDDDPQLTVSDAGKPLVTADGEIIGAIEDINRGRAFVRPTPGLLNGHGAWIGGSTSRDDTFELDCSKIADVRDDAIVLGPEV